MSWSILDGVLKREFEDRYKKGIPAQMAENGETAVPDGVKSIGRYAFLNCRGLTKIHLPDSIKTIESSAFFGCSALTEICIPEGIRRIEKEAFGECGRLRRIRIPTGIEHIGEDIFYRCYGLEEIFLPARFRSVLDRDMIDQAECIACPISLKEVPAAARRKLCIGFALNEKEYSSELFKEYTAYIKRNCRRLCEEAFDYPPLLRLMCREKLITVGSIDQFIEEASDREEIELTAVLLDYQANVLTMKAVFKARERRERQREQQEDRLIERMETRMEKEGLAQLNFAADGKLDRFERRSLLKDFIEWQGGKLLASVSEQVDYLISNERGSDRCREAEQLGIEILTEGQFRLRAYQSKAIVVPEGVEIIPFGLFHGCGGIESVTLSSTVKEIEGDAFGGCIALKSIEIPNSVQKIDSRAFTGCTALEKIIVAPQHPVYRFESGLLLTKDGTLVLALPRLEEVCIPDGVTSIGSYAFANAAALKSVHISAFVSSIEERAFSNCTKLSEIELPDALARIGEAAFERCTELRELRLPDGITSVPSKGLRGCENLTRIILPESVAVIEDGAFERCGMLEGVVLPRALQAIGNGAFRWCGALERISVRTALDLSEKKRFGAVPL